MMRESRSRRQQRESRNQKSKRSFHPISLLGRFCHSWASNGLGPTHGGSERRSGLSIVQPPEKLVRIKFIQSGYREGCGEIEHGLVQNQQTLAHQSFQQGDAERYGERIGARSTCASQKSDIKAGAR